MYYNLRLAQFCPILKLQPCPKCVAIPITLHCLIVQSQRGAQCTLKFCSRFFTTVRHGAAPHRLETQVPLCIHSLNAELRLNRIGIRHKCIIFFLKVTNIYFTLVQYMFELTRNNSSSIDIRMKSAYIDIYNGKWNVIFMAKKSFSISYLFFFDFFQKVLKISLCI